MCSKFLVWIKDEKSAAKFHYIKTVSGNVVAHSIAFRVVSIYWQGDDPFPPEILPPSDLPSPVNGILWEMSELITQEQIAIGSSNLVEGLNTWPAMYDHWPKSKGHRSRSRNVISSSNAIMRQRMVISTSNLVETVTARCASRDILSRSVGQLERK